MVFFIYLSYGTHRKYRNELRYSVATLLSRMGNVEAKVLLYTDHPEFFEGWPVEIISIADTFNQMTAGGRFLHRAKAAVLLDAMKRKETAEKYVYVDSDTSFTGPVPEIVSLIDERSALLWSYESTDPFPAWNGFETQLPHSGKYAYRPSSRMFNAGIIGVHRSHRPLVEDCVTLVDAFLEKKLIAHTTEQFTWAEVFSLQGLKINVCRNLVHHYYRSSDRKYMHWKFETRYPEGEHFVPLNVEIPYSYLRARLYKFLGV